MSALKCSFVEDVTVPAGC